MGALAKALTRSRAWLHFGRSFLRTIDDRPTFILDRICSGTLRGRTSYACASCNLRTRKSRKNSYMKRNGKHARMTAGAEGSHLCLDSQFDIPRLIIPIGVHIPDVAHRMAGGLSSRE